MRKSFLLYALVFTGLIAVYIYVTGQRMLESKQHELEILQLELEQTRSKADSLFSENISGGSFSLVSNEEAMSYLENRGYDPTEIAKRVEDELISRNSVDADNDLVPYEGMDGYFRINKVKLLNHKWAIASFTDGSYWGDLFVSFEIDEQGELILQTEKALLYPPE